MPALKTDVAIYLKRVQDSLRTSPAYTSAEYTIGATTSRVRLIARAPGTAGNNITIAATVPAGTSGLTITTSGTAINIALAVNTGAVVGASNTATLIAAAINAHATAGALVLAVLPGDVGTGSISLAITATHLAGGTGNEGNVLDTCAPYFLRAQDTASVLEVLSDALNTTAALTATGGSATTVVDGAATFVANSQIGNTVVFTGNTTTALTGVHAVVRANSTTTLTFAPGALPAVPVAGDTYSILGTLVSTEISALRNGHGRGDAATGHALSDMRLVTSAFVKLVQQLGGATIAETTLWSGNSTATGSSLSTVKLNTLGGKFRVDEFKGQKLAVTGYTARKIISNDENTVTFGLPFGSVPGAVAVAITVPADSGDASANYTGVAGATAGDNKRLAELLRAATTAVTAFTLPT